MRMALEQARAAAELGEIPVGAVMVKDGEVISRAHNMREAGDPTAHAEILALRGAARALGGWRLNGCMLVVTKEPCPMCAGALAMARVSRLVFGAYDPLMGCCGSVHDLLDGTFGAPAEVIGGVCEQECALLLSEFLGRKRLTKKESIGGE